MTVSQVGPKTESEIGIERGCKGLTHKSETVSQVGVKTESVGGINIRHFNNARPFWNK